ncbi:MAG: ATP-binding protein, partial [Myxococcota bacterium]
MASGPSSAVGAFSVDVAGLLEALTEQFPDPLLCVRELVQNAADAGARRIDVDVSYDAGRGLARLSVRDDGRGMGAGEVEGYLEIGRSEKGPRERGRFGIGKLSPYALGFSCMIVETCTGAELHRLEFEPDGSGRVETLSPGPRGTVVKVFREASRESAEQLSEQTFGVVKETCGSLSIPLYVNGVAVNHDVALPTPYVVRFEGEAGTGAIGVGSEPIRTLMGGGIVLETSAPILGSELSYILDGPRLSPTLSRNAVRRDRAFEDLLRQAQAQVPHLVASAAQVLRQRVERLRQQGDVVERALDADDRAALEWLRARLLEPEEMSPSRSVREAPVLETADGDLVSAAAVASVLRTERRVPISRVPRTRDEIAGYVDRGIPVLLLYRDLEDFLDRQEIPTVEVDGLDDGVEIEARAWSEGERALVDRPVRAVERRQRMEWGLGVLLGLAALAVILTAGYLFASIVEVPNLSPSAAAPAEVRAAIAPAPPAAAPPAPATSRRWVSMGFAFTAGVGVAV